MRRQVTTQFEQALCSDAVIGWAIIFQSKAGDAVGGVAGIVGGIAVSKAISMIAGWPTPIAWIAVIGGFLFSAAVGISFGYYPARKAAQLDPIAALRYERTSVPARACSPGLMQCRKGTHAALIVDRMLPGLDGLTLVKTLRSEGCEAPALFLTTMSDLNARVEGLEACADDYLTKPLAIPELKARINALIRRTQRNRVESLHLRVGSLEFDVASRGVTREGRTALGDWMADDAGVGFGALIFGAALAVIAVTILALILILPQRAGSHPNAAHFAASACI